MGLFKTAKLAAMAFKPSNLKAGIDAARNPPSQQELDALVATLTPEQRAAYDANMAQVAAGRAESQAAWEAAKATEERTRVLWGEAGDYVYGKPMTAFGTPDEINAAIAERGVFDMMGELRAQRKGEFKDGLKQSFNRDAVKQLRDPAERVRVALEQRAARDAARTPYLAPTRAEARISRLATRGKSQVADLLAWLDSTGLGARPDLVFGLYRVPDRISPVLTPHSEKGRLVEWDVVHAPPPGGAPPAAPVAASSFAADEQWVARRVGEPSVLDEDLGLAFLQEAGIGPEQCLGLARISEFRVPAGSSSGEHDSAPPQTIVRGLVALHPAGAHAEHALARMRESAPLPLASGPPGVHVEILNWHDVARAIHPKVFEPPPVPSPFPALPATPQELLCAYLDIVGVQPADCYSAQATVDRLRAIQQGGLFTTNWGTKQPCADGKDRSRAHACEIVVIAYRDRPEYAEGRARWKAYTWDVLQARLQNGVRRRPPVTDPESDGLDDIVPTRPLRAVVRAAAVVDWLYHMEWGAEQFAPHRYCWPPTDR